MLRASGVDARLLPACGAVAELGSAAAVVLVGSPRYRDIAAADEAAGDEQLWHVSRAIQDLVRAGEAAATAVLPVVLPAHTLNDLPDFLAEHTGPRYRLKSLSTRGVAALVADLRERCGTADQGPRHELRLEVGVADGRLRCTTTLAGTVLCERDEPLPFGRDEVWTLLGHPDAEARLAQLGRRLSAALFDPDTLDDLTTLVTKAVDGAALDVVVDADSAAHELPFELIRLADQQVLAAVDGVTVTRTVVGATPQVHPPAPGPLKILAAVGAPEHTDNTPLDVEAEMQAIVEEVGAFGRAEVTILEVAGLAEIAEALRRDAYHVLHLSAHGSPHGVELEDADGNAVDVQAEDLVRVLRRGGRSVPLIVLSSCHGAADADTGLAMTLVRHGAARVIAMQTEISDRYATGLITRVYRALVEDNIPVAAALARARAAMFREAQDSDEYRAPEYAVAALFASADGPLWDPDATPEPLSNPTELPAGASARDLLLGELVGRRALLRTVSAVLRDEVAADGTSSLVNGVMLTGVAGIGKTAVAGRVLTRLRDDIHDPWSIVVHSGVWNPQRLLADVAATPAGAGLADVDEPDAAWTALAEVLRTQRLLLHFDDFEHNLTGDGADFVDAAFGEVFVALCRAASRGKILLGGRYPVPREVPLLRVEVPVLSDAETMRLVLRLPALRELDDDRDLVLQAVGGHPRLLEFVDALLRGKKGQARLPEVTERLRRLAKQEGLSLARSPAAAPDAEEAAGQAITLAGRDMRLAELLESLTIAERETLLQAAVMWLPVSYDDLAFAMQDGPPSAEDRKATGAHLDRLRDLSLLTGAQDSVLMQAWLRVALDDLHGPRRTDRHRRAAAMCSHMVDGGRGTLGVLLETVRHLSAADGFDALAALTDAVLPNIDGAPNVAGLLSAVTSVLPDDHPAYADLLSRERDALAAAGRTAAAAEKGQELVDLTARLAEAPRRDAAAQVALSAALDGQGRLLLRLGRTGEARALYERALDIDLSLSQAEPGNAMFDANLAFSYEKLARLALDDAAVDQARDLVQRSLDIRRRLAEADPDDLAAQRDLGACLTALAAVHHAEGDIGQARQVLEQALVLRRRAVELDPDEMAPREDLLDVVSALADVLRPGDVELVRQLAEEAAAIADELTEADGGNHLWHRKRLTACWRLGDLALAAGDVATASTHLTEALSVAQQLAEADPAAVGAQCDLIAAWHRMADLAVADGRPEEVRGQLERAVDVAQDLVARLARHSGPHRDLAECRRRLADWLRDRGDRAEARAMFKKAMASWRRAALLEPQDLRARLAQAEMHGRLAELARDAGQADRARRQWREALAIAEQVHGAAPTEAHLAAVTRYHEELDGQ